jgi:hypothetical protein
MLSLNPKLVQLNGRALRGVGTHQSLNPRACGPLARGPSVLRSLSADDLPDGNLPSVV